MKTTYKHVEANIYNYSVWIDLINPKDLKNIFEKLLNTSGFTNILFNEHHFPTQGYTCFWLLAESHLAIHTFPEDNKSYIELSSCNKEKLNTFQESLHMHNFITE